jgi:glutamine---fructose-6-phosphate transaminase (isomerizing)
MCGIIGYVGKRQALPLIIDGLKRLEYRGYDSAGVAIWNGKEIEGAKTIGRVSALEKTVSQKKWSGNTAIAHTRWATHGKPTHQNAHPHIDCTREIYVVHNGIVENHDILREALMREGHDFASDTDSEVLAHLFERAAEILRTEEKQPNLEDVVIDGLRHIEGTFGIAVLAKWDPGKIVAARRGSPLIAGIGETEYFVASDAAPLVDHTKHVIYLHDNELISLIPDGFHIYDLAKKAIHKSIEVLEWDITSAEKNGYPHFMKKEIFEGPQTLQNATRGRLSVDSGEFSIKLGGIERIKDRISLSTHFLITACGTSYYAGLVGKYLFEEFVKMPTSIEYASEFRYSNQITKADTVALLISQSGETADTLFALREIKKHGALTLGIVNVVGSTIARESNAGVYNHAGPEIGVASTKAFISQIGVLLMLVLFLGREKNILSQSEAQKIGEEIKMLPKKMESILTLDAKIRVIAKKYANFKNFLYLGRKYQYPVALEGALKLKEISYIHAEGYAGGEMKHGPIALIDENFPSIVLAINDSVYEKTLSNIEEIKARGGPVLAIATEGDKRIKKLADDIIYVPETLECTAPFLSTIPLQLFAYHVADILGLDVDKPRNLAKSVTVE